MTFTVLGTIKAIEKSGNKFLKVLLQDEKNNHVIVNIPLEKEQDIQMGTKVNIWGNVSAFNYQSKWYNNLFAQTVVPENKKYLLVKREQHENNSTTFTIVEYSKDPFSAEVIKANNPDAIVAEKEYNENKFLETEPGVFTTRIYLPLYSSLEYWHLQNSLSQKKLVLEWNKINLNENVNHFYKKFANPEHYKLFFSFPQENGIEFLP